MLSLLIAAVLPAGAAVSTLHPRIYVRNDASRTGAGLTLAQLRARMQDAAYARWRGPVGTRGPAAAVEHAARYLETGDGAELAEVRSLLTTQTYSYQKNDVGGFLAGAEMAIALDWVYDGLTQEERRAAMANIVATADSSLQFLLTGQPDINHNYTYMALNAVAVCGLVLSGEGEPYGTKAKEYLSLAQKFLEAPGMVFDTWNAREGAWGEGSHYTFHETLRTLILTLQAYRSASDTDYFPGIRREHGSFISKAGRFLIACTRPDMTFERTGDTLASRAVASLTVPLTVEMLAAGTDDAAESARLRSFSRALIDAYGLKAMHAEYGWGMRIFHDPRASLEPSYTTLPRFQRLGAGTYEQFTLRGGWGPDSAMVTIVAGDHYTDHQHFDKGQFLIYRNGGLAIDSGAYSGMYQPGKHANEYAPRTLAHNCLLVYDAAQQMPKGYDNDGGQTILRGKQHHGDWPTYLAHRDAEGLHTAQVEASDLQQDLYTYIRVNLSSAYGGRVERYDRQFAYVPGAGLLVVFDRVSSTLALAEKRWLLHFQDPPSVDGRLAPAGVESFPGGSVTAVRHRGSLELGGPPVRYDGTLSVETLLPVERTITTVGGEGFEFYSRFLEKNYPVADARVTASIRESGAWRMEVAPEKKARDDQFLNVLQFPAPADGAGRQASLVRDTAGGATGVHVQRDGRAEVVLFSSAASGGPITLPLEYRVTTSSAASHLLTELPPSAEVLIRINGGAAMRRHVNGQGVLQFDDAGRGARVVTVRLAARQ